MFNTFAPDAKYSSGDLIPHGALAFANVTVQGLANSQSTGGRYAKLELTIVRGPYERRKLFPMVGDPSDARNSEKYVQMSLAALQHMLEAAGIFDPAKPETYQAFANSTFEQILTALEDKTVAVKIKIEKGQDGYQDKNVVADWLSPNPASSNKKTWDKLLAGGDQVALESAAQAGFAGFSQTAAPATTPAPATVVAGAQAAPAAGNTPAWLK